jgi:hypothetical protein
MWRIRAVALSVLAVSLAHGQTDANYQAAMEKLKAKAAARQQAATQPVTQADYDQLHAENLQLKARIAALEAELANLRQQQNQAVPQQAVAPLKKPAQHNLKWAGKGNPLDFVKVGMSLDEAKDVFDNNPILRSAHGDTKSYDIIVPGAAQDGRAYVLSVQVVDGKLVSFSAN